MQRGIVVGCLHHSKVRRVELTCSPSVGTYLLSNKRSELDRYERKLNKRIVVRISEEIATDRVSYYAYDERGVDIELTSLSAEKVPSIDSLVKAEKSFIPAGDAVHDDKPSGRTRRRGRRSVPLAEAASISTDDSLDEELASLEKPEVKKKAEKVSKPANKSGSTPAGKAVRVYEFARELGKTSKEIVEICKENGLDVRGHMSKMSEEVVTIIKVVVGVDEKSDDKKPKRRRRRRGGRRKTAKTVQTENAESTITTSSEDKKQSSKTTKKKTNKKRSRRSGAKTTQSVEVEKVEPKAKAPAKPRRSLYGGSRRSVSSDEVQQSMVDR